MVRRALVVALLVALLVPSAASAQSGGAFGPLPQAAPAPTGPPQGGGGWGRLPQAAPAPPATPTADKSNNSLPSDLGGRTTLYVIAGGLLIAFVAIGVFISRDARRALPKGHRPDSRRL